MNKVYFEAIRALPEDWIDDSVRVLGMAKEVIVAAHPEHPPMIYKEGKWETIKWTDKSFEHMKEKDAE